MKPCVRGSDLMRLIGILSHLLANVTFWPGLSSARRASDALPRFCHRENLFTSIHIYSTFFKLLALTLALSSSAEGANAFEATAPFVI